MRASILAVAVATLFATSSTAAPNLETSWGKADVSFSDYRLDAALCTAEAYFLDVSNTEAARVLAEASRKLETISATGISNSGNAQAGVNPSTGAAAGTPWSTTYDPRLEGALEISQRFSRTVAAAQPERQIAEIARIQRAAAAQCLSARGYREFRLTEDQARQLRKLKAGSDARRAYLFSLARDPQILAAQSL